MNEALFRRNAEACENAKHPTCTCACGGEFHGKAHSETWIINRVASEMPPAPIAVRLGLARQSELTL